jgi:hypothetical protein
MFRPLVIPLFAVALLLCPVSAMAQKQGEVKQVRRAPAQGVSSVRGESVRTVEEIRLLEEQGARVLLTRLAEAFLLEDARAVSDCMAGAEIVFSLDPEESGADPDRTPLQSREQIYYRMREYFERVTVEELECDCPEENLGVEDAHGVLEVGLQDSPRSRLFVRLRRADDAWRVVELRALP